MILSQIVIARTGVDHPAILEPAKNDLSVKADNRGPGSPVKSNFG
jgi:hypothetical protein